MSILTRIQKTAGKTTYRVRQEPTRLTVRDMGRLKEAASLGVLDIDYARWLEEQVGLWRQLAFTLEAEVEKLEKDKREAKRRARQGSMGEGGKLYCSFCGKSQSGIKKLIAGPGVYICNECIDICNEIIDEDQRAERALRGQDVTSPVQ